MKLYVKANSDIGYLYILKHGTGPGTVPRDVVFLKEKDLPNGYTAVWLDRFLTSGELRAYDIPSETEINRYLDRIGYCQKDGDVVTCDEVEACDTVTAAIISDSEDIASQVENDLGITCRDDGDWIYIFSDEDGVKSPYSYTELNSYYTKLIKNKEYNRFKPVKKSFQYFEDKIAELTNASNSDEEFKDNYRNFLINFLGLPSVEACDVTASSDVDADLPTFREFATTEWELLNDGSKRLKLKDLFVYFGTDKQWNASNPGYWYEIRIGDKTYKESKKYSIKNKERCYKAMQRAVSELLQSDNIESCDKVTASTHRYSAGRIEDDGTEDFYYDTGFDSYDEACDWGINHDCTHIYDREKDEFVPIESCDTKYFANMVSASNDPELDDDFLIEGYYDNQRRGLAESAETSDVSALNELANEYANKGYYIVVHNLTDGVITEFSADSWFDDLARDGGAGLFMSW